eukprot:Awhi_evm1s8505
MSDCEFERVTLLEEGENSEEEGTSTPKPSLTHKPQGAIRQRRSLPSTLRGSECSMYGTRLVLL